LTSKRLLYTSLILLAGVAVFAIQPWFKVELIAGDVLFIEGLAAFPTLGASLLVDALAAALFLYLKSRWGAVFLAGASIALIFELAQVSLVFLGSDRAILEPFIAKSTGIANWASQLDEVVINHQTTFSALVAVILALAVSLLQLYTGATTFRRLTIQAKKGSSATRIQVDLSISNATEEDHSLWQETNPNRN
jgi:hypothetical protein